MIYGTGGVAFGGVKNSVADLLDALSRGEGDMIASGLTRTPGRTQRFDFGPAYQRVRQQVVCRRGGRRPATVDDLAGVHLEVVADSSYVARLRTLRKTHPGLHWDVDADNGTEQLLREVWKGDLDCTVADSEIVAINRRYFPNLVVAFDLSAPQPLAWVLPRHASALSAAMHAWMVGFSRDGRLAALMRRYYGHVKVFDYVDTRAYVRRIRSRFPKYRTMFDKAAETYDLPPLVLAAQAYQESHWNPGAESPTGVRGMMMLTRSTADTLGVRNRLDAQSSIDGGAAYLARLTGRLSDRIQPADRIWFALAAYNVGLGHVRDARALAARLGKNPDRWADVSEVFPLLSNHRYYRTLKHGYARGSEPVRYIQRIRNYTDILRHKLKSEALDQQAPTDDRIAG